VIGAEGTSEMGVCERKSRCVRSSRMRSESRRRWVCARAGAGTLAVRVAARRSSGSGGVGVAHAEDGSWGKTTAAAGRRAARGICREQEVVLIGSQRRGAAVQGGSGRRQAAWHGGKKPARGRGRRQQFREGHVARFKTALRRRGWRTWLARAAAARGRETEERERER
jgi:hypothetical protein